MGGGLGFFAGYLSGRLGWGRLGAAFALGGAVRNVSLLWSATMGLGTPEGEAVMMLGTFWTFILPAMLALVRWRRDQILPSARSRPGPQRPRRQGMITARFRAVHPAPAPRHRKAGSPG